MKYLLEVPEFKRRITELTVTGKHVTEEMLLDVLKRLRDDATSGKIPPDSVPIATVRNMINRIERGISLKADS